MNSLATPACGFALALSCAGPAMTLADDPLHTADLQQQADIERLDAVNTGELEFLTGPATAPELHTQMSLRLDPSSLHDGWVDMRQCQRGLDGMQRTEIVYRYAAMRALRVLGSSGIDAARIEGQSVQLRGVAPGAHVCVGAEVGILRALGDGRYRLVSGPYHRRFFDGYFPLHLRFDVTYPAELLRWVSITPEPRAGYALSAAPGRLAIDARFTGMLTLELEFAQTGYATPQPPNPQ